MEDRAICGKAKELYADLLKELLGMSAQDVKSKASRGWFEKFKKRTSSCVCQGEVASSDAMAAGEESCSSEPQPCPSEPQPGPSEAKCKELKAVK